MVNINLDCGLSERNVLQINSGTKVEDLWTQLKTNLGLQKETFFITQNGRLLYNEDIIADGNVTLRCKLLGGKGGFGSMLRAIGAQIEKTTNREACRDLSGRRLRDINEEKRVKAWIEKQGDREKDDKEKKKRKLEKLCTEPKHDFNDKKYEEERSKLIEKVCIAVEEAYKVAVIANGNKRKNEDNNEEPAIKKRKGLLDEELDLDLSQVSDSSDED